MDCRVGRCGKSFDIADLDWVLFLVMPPALQTKVVLTNAMSL
jgi:hypothetical protein